MTRNLRDYAPLKISPGACPERNSKIPRFARNDRSEVVEMTESAIIQSSPIRKGNPFSNVVATVLHGAGREGS